MACRFFGKRYPLAIAFELTNSCNLDCPHCYNIMLPKKMGKEASLKLLEEMHEAGCRVVSFTGGEPLLIRYLPELMIKAKSLGMWVQYTTNGTYLAQREEEMKRADPDMIQVSVDGHKFAHDQLRGDGSFEQAMRALDIVKKNGWRCLFVSVISKHTTRESLAFVLLKAIDVGAFVSFQPMCDYPGLEPSEEQLAGHIDFLKEVRRIRTEDAFFALLDKHNVRFDRDEKFSDRRDFYNPMDQPMVALNHLYKDPKIPFVPCAGGTLFGRVMPDGQLISCYEAMDPSDKANVLKVGFAEAWKNISIHRGKELHHHRLELNLIYSLSFSTIMNVLYYHLLNYRQGHKLERLKNFVPREKVVLPVSE